VCNGARLYPALAAKGCAMPLAGAFSMSARHRRAEEWADGFSIYHSAV